ncbi:type I polyketide synthase [Streptomyces sp. LX-29]|uniref:type I polyketide synthase n=1 Tax=Streptomyces sp. LX-29 TaxID=2900152 RepID=UPI00240E71F8|nr:type I polyketide synthase [Streptomyces sp. LX-29]WFB10697.1 type I polyketide synthase [Streptomyces sp. LX-29]
MDHHTRGSGDAMTDVAVVGMGCRLPGGADTPAAFWQLLRDGRDAVGEPPPGRPELLPDPAPEPDRRGADAVAQGGYLSDVSGFDAGFFGVSGREADVLDPQHRLLLEVAWEALEHGGFAPDRLKGTRTGVFVGLSYGDYMERLAELPQSLEGSVLTNGHCVAPGRISYLLGLHGPCLALDTACSSSLVALHLAGQALRSGECDLALVGGVSLALGTRVTGSFARMGMLSPTGRCHSFDAAADGFVRGEGCGIVVLKRLGEALRDDDRVLAVVRGTAVNQDGASDGLAAPSAAAQQALYEEALARAGVDPGEVGMVEAHGTGTPLGDPTEFAGLTAVYGQGRDRCALTSVKTNLGHLEPAAGVTGLIKAILCLGNGLIPPNLHFTRWNPALSPERTRFFVPTALTPWPTPAEPRLAAVSSFGFSGTNAHAVLAQAPPARRPLPRAVRPDRPDSADRHDRADRNDSSDGPDRPDHHDRPDHREAAPRPEVFLVPAGSPDALPTAARRLADWLEDDGAEAPLRDVAHTLALRRCPGRGRLGVVAATRGELVAELRGFAAGQAGPRTVSGGVGPDVVRRPVWVFSGHGSQWPGMGRALLAEEPAFAEALTEVDALIRAESGLRVLDAIRRGAPLDGCGRVQPALFALQVALAALWRAHGVEPAAVIGHSLGEVAAAVVAGGLSLADGVRVVCRRSALLERIAGSGAMATVGLGAREVAEELTAAGADGVSVAVLAAPGSTVIAGDTTQVERLVAVWEARSLPAAMIAVDVASHSPQVDPLLPELAAALAEVEPRRPGLPFYSTVLDEPTEPAGFDAAYWCANLRRPVRFTAALAAAAADRHRVYVEVSPHPVVAHSLARSLPGPPDAAVVVPTLRRGEPERATFRTQLAALHCAGVPVDWTVLYGDGRLAEVPPIVFDRQRHWVPPAPLAAGPATEPAAGPAATPTAAPAASPAAEGGTGAPLPGVRREAPGDPAVHYWRGEAGTGALPWLADHTVHGSTVLPGAAHHALALTCGCAVFDAPPEEIDVIDLRFLELLRLAELTPVATTVTPTGPDRARCEIFGRDPEGGWVRQATAELHRRTVPRQPRPESVDSLAQRHPLSLDPAALYASMRACGLVHGPAFQGVTELYASRRGDGFWARLELPAAAWAPEHGLAVHPVLVDLCAQLPMACLIPETEPSLILPVGMRAVRVLGDPSTAVYGQVRLVDPAADSVTGHVRLLDEAGRPVLAVDGLRFARRTEPAPDRTEDWFLQAGWQPAALGESTPGTAPKDVVITGGNGSSVRTLEQSLQATGAQVEVWTGPDGDEPVESLRETLAWRLSTRSVPPRSVALLCEARPGEDPTVAGLRHARFLVALAQVAADVPGTPPRLYAVTRGARAVLPGEETDLGPSALRGLVRVLALEHPELRATLVDADPADAELRGVAAELAGDGVADEVGLRGTERYVSRLGRVSPAEWERTGAAARTVRYGLDGFRLRAAHLGDLGSLELAAVGRRVPGQGEVELRVQAAGLNFRDVLTAMGLLPGDRDVQYRIGFECAGVVTATGPGVTEVRPGDQVLAVDLRGGAFGSFLTVSSAAVAPLPAGLDPVVAARLPVAYLTAWYALREVARLTAGERVLIHSATGGTGLAAIEVARTLGAEVLATAGSEEKRRCLRAMGVAEVMDSRSLDFRDQVWEATGGEGVDVVLNSLSGAAIRAGLETLRPFGRFVELGVRDILADSPLGLAPLRHNITLSTVDLIELQRARPDAFAALLREVLGEVAAGRLKSLPGIAFPLSAATDAFRHMAQARHIGKVVLTVPERGEATAVLPEGAPTVRPGGAYLVTGGLRGLGLATARWLADRGAGHLVLNGRSRPSPVVAELLDELTAGGTRITVVLGDIADARTGERLMAAVEAEGAPLYGVVHCAMALEDAAVVNIRDDQLRRVWAPKAVGAWRLHQVTADRQLDWFVVFSSMASLLGNPGQGAYAAANSWLDGFAAWRSARGLPTLAVNWGPWGETGVATDFAARGYRTLSTEEGLTALELLLRHRRTQTGVIPGEPDTWVPAAGRRSDFFGLFTRDDRPDGDGRPADAERTGDGGPPRDDGIRARLQDLPVGLGRRAALEIYLADHIRAVLRLRATSLDPQIPLKALGFDSLLAMELRSILERNLEIQLPGNFVWRHSTVAALAEGLAERMGLELTPP